MVTKTFVVFLASSLSIKPIFCSSLPVLSACSQLTDKRTVLRDPDFQNLSIITIPRSFSLTGSMLEFALVDQEEKLSCYHSPTPLKNVGLKWNRGIAHKGQAVYAQGWMRDFFIPLTALKTIPKHFTREGQFFSGIQYHRPVQDYCVKSISDKGLKLQVCPINCTINICIPKCCALDELIGKDDVCRRISQNETSWLPKIYKDVNPLEEVSTPSQFYIHQFSSTCNHKNPLRSYIGHITSVLPKDVFPPKIKLVSNSISNVVYPMVYYPHLRRWRQEDFNFCADGTTLSDNDLYSGNPEDLILFFCSPELENRKDKVIQFHTTHAWLYLTSTVLSCVFLFATVMVYIAIISNQNLQGLSVLSFSIACLGEHAFLVVAHVVSLLPGYIRWSRINERSRFCMTIAIFAHFFGLSAFFWLTIMNSLMLHTFSSLRTVRSEPLRWTKFAMFSVLGWGIPFILVAIFITLDFIYSDPYSEVCVPEYGSTSCYVAALSRGYYVYLPRGISVGVNCILIFLTLRIFWKARRNKTGTQTGNKYTAKLFFKLFFVMGGTYASDFISWQYSTVVVKPWLVVVLELFSSFSPVLVFFLLCLNKRVLKQLKEKYPSLYVPVETFFRSIKSKIFSKSNSLPENDKNNNVGKTDTSPKNTETNSNER